jgi:hypothetical protein
MKACWIILIFPAMDSCIDPFQISADFKQEILVVDGLITDQPGPYSIKISRTQSLNNQLDNTNHETGASVTIYDDQGNSELLKETVAGTYQTKIFTGVIGRTYHLELSTKEGYKYTSNPEELISCGEIIDVRIEHEKNLRNIDGYQIYLDAEVRPEQNGLVRWRWTGTYEILTFPGLRTKGKYDYDTRKTFDIPDPIPCSGLISVSETLVKIADCECCNCWVTQYSDPILSNLRFIQGNSIKDQKIAFVPINRRIFYNKYYLEVEQMSLSKTVYDFWKSVSAQKTTGSDLFQTPPPRLSTNMVATNSKSLPVMGIFSASSIKRKVIQITRDQLPYPVPNIDTLIASCLTIYPNTTNTKPSFW